MNCVCYEHESTWEVACLENIWRHKCLHARRMTYIPVFANIFPLDVIRLILDFVVTDFRVITASIQTKTERGVLYEVQLRPRRSFRAS